MSNIGDNKFIPIFFVMEIKEVYLDLKSWPQYAKKNKSVFTLESEAFKDPLKFKFVYDNSELNKFNNDINELRHDIQLIKDDIKSLVGTIKLMNEAIDKQRKRFDNHLDEHTSIDTSIQELDQNQKDTEKRIKLLAERIGTINSKNDEIVEYINIMNNRISKLKPMIFELSDFVSWNGVYYFNTLQVPCGDYAVIQTTNILEHNEYVLNRDSTEYYKIHVDEKWYTPSIQLQTETGLDTPTATIQITFLFFPM